MEKLTIKEAAKYLNYSETSVRGAIYNRKTLPYEKIGNKVSILKIDIDNYLNKVRKSVFKRYSVDIIKEWLELYKEGKTFKDISNIYNCDPTTVSKQLKLKFPDFKFDIYHFKLSEEERKMYNEAMQLYYSENNISLNNIKEKYPEITYSKFTSYLKRSGKKVKERGIIYSNCQNHDFFENIDSEIKSYLLGFFAADGHLEYNRDSFCLKIGVKPNDAHILMLFNKYLCNNKANILYCNNKIATLSIGSKKLGEDLIKLEFDNNKTLSFNKLPNLPENQMRHFLRGFFDGDGSISLNRRTHKKRLNGYNRIFSMVSVSKNLLNEVGNLLPITNFKIDETTNVGRTTVIDGKKITSTMNCYQLKVFTQDDLKSIYHYFYDDANFYFKRKKDIFQMSFLDAPIIDGLLQGNL